MACQPYIDTGGMGKDKTMNRTSPTLKIVYSGSHVLSCSACKDHLNRLHAVHVPSPMALLRHSIIEQLDISSN